MSDIEFLVSDFKEKDKVELDEIVKKVKSKPLKSYKEAVFLKRFVLSMMKQYYIPKHNEIKNLQHQINVAIPDVKHIIPHIMPKAPPKLDIGGFMPSVPSKLNLFSEVSQPQIEEPKKEFKLNLSMDGSQELKVPQPIGKKISKEIEVPKPV